MRLSRAYYAAFLLVTVSMVILPRHFLHHFEHEADAHAPKHCGKDLHLERMMEGCGLGDLVLPVFLYDFPPLLIPSNSYAGLVFSNPGGFFQNNSLSLQSSRAPPGSLS